jgi:hypothetical protein
MLSRSSSTSALNDEKNNLAMVDKKITVAGGSLKKGLDRLTQVLERRIDRQVLQAQIRAYDHSPVLSEKSRYM